MIIACEAKTLKRRGGKKPKAEPPAPPISERSLQKNTNCCLYDLYSHRQVSVVALAFPLVLVWREVTFILFIVAFAFALVLLR